jgi:hypothetical protein
MARSGLPITDQATNTGERDDAGDTRHGDRSHLSDSGGA